MRYFEDYDIGKSFVSRSRTLTEGDITHFAHLTGDFHPTHFDEEFAKSSFYGERVSHGLLNLSIAIGMMNEWEYRSRSIMAFIRLDCRFLKPVRINDSIYAKTSILSKKEWKRPEKGIVVFGLEIVNQRGKSSSQRKLRNWSGRQSTFECQGRIRKIRKHTSSSF